MFRPDRKNSEVFLPDVRATARPIASVAARNDTMMTQSIVCRAMMRAVRSARCAVRSARCAVKRWAEDREND